MTLRKLSTRRCCPFASKIGMLDSPLPLPSSLFPFCYEFYDFFRVRPSPKVFALLSYVTIVFVFLTSGS